MTPNGVKKKKKQQQQQKPLKDMEQIIGIQSCVIVHISPTSWEFFLNSPFEVLIPAPGIPLCNESHSVVHRMIQPDHCLNSQSKSQVWGWRMVQSRI